MDRLSESHSEDWTFGNTDPTPDSDTVWEHRKEVNQLMHQAEFTWPPLSADELRERVLEDVYGPAWRDVSEFRYISNDIERTADSLHQSTENRTKCFLAIRNCRYCTKRDGSDHNDTPQGNTQNFVSDQDPHNADSSSSSQLSLSSYAMRCVAWRHNIDRMYTQRRNEFGLANAELYQNSGDTEIDPGMEQSSGDTEIDPEMEQSSGDTEIDPEMEKIFQRDLGADVQSSQPESKEQEQEAPEDTQDTRKVKSKSKRLLSPFQERNSAVAPKKRRRIDEKCLTTDEVIETPSSSCYVCSRSDQWDDMIECEGSHGSRRWLHYTCAGLSQETLSSEGKQLLRHSPVQEHTD